MFGFSMIFHHFWWFFTQDQLEDLGLLRLGTGSEGRWERGIQVVSSSGSGNPSWARSPTKACYAKFGSAVTVAARIFSWPEPLSWQMAKLCWIPKRRLRGAFIWPWRGGLKSHEFVEYTPKIPGYHGWLGWQFSPLKSPFNPDIHLDNANSFCCL